MQNTDLKRKEVKHNFTIGKLVLLGQIRLRKSMTRYADPDLVLIAIKTSMITVRDEEGNEITRDVLKFKRRNFEDPSGNRTNARLGSEPYAERPRTETETNNAATNGLAQRATNQTDNVRERFRGERNEAREDVSAGTSEATRAEDRRFSTCNRRKPDRLQVGQRS